MRKIRLEIRRIIFRTGDTRRQTFSNYNLLQRFCLMFSSSSPPTCLTWLLPVKRWNLVAFIGEVCVFISYSCWGQRFPKDISPENYSLTVYSFAVVPVSAWEARLRVSCAITKCDRFYLDYNRQITNIYTIMCAKYEEKPRERSRRFRQCAINILRMLFSYFTSLVCISFLSF